MTPEQEAVLRRNIDKMIAAGADDAEVAAYAESKGFKIKFSDNNQTAGKIAYPAVEGIAGLAGMPRALMETVAAPVTYDSPGARAHAFRGLTQEQAQSAEAEMAEGMPAVAEAASVLPGHEGVRRFLVDKVGLPEPVRAESAAGRIAQDIGTGVIQGAPFGVAGGVRGALMGGLGGAMGATFGAGARELNAPEGVQAAAAVIGGLVGGRGASTARRIAQPTGSKILGDALRGLTPAEYNAARSLFSDAQRAGSPVTWSEAINQVTNGRMKQLASAARVAEQTPGGSRILSPIMAQRSGGNAAAMEQELNRIGPMPTGTALANVPAEVKKAATGAMRGVEKMRTKAVDPYYNAATAATPAQVIGNRMQDWLDLLNRPAVKTAWKDAQTNLANRGDPVHQWIRLDAKGNIVGIDKVPTPRDIIEMDKALGRIVEQSKTATGRVAEADALAVAKAREDLRALAQTIPSYAAGRKIFKRISEQVVDPLRNAPIGRLADAPAELPAQRNILAPLGRQDTLDPTQIKQTMGLLRLQNAQAPVDWVRTNLKSIFDETNEALVGGANEWGGAKFAKIIAGNAQQRANLQAMIEALPNGRVRWTGFQRLLEVLQAQGKRQPAGSLTAFNAEAIQSLKSGRFGVGLSDISPFKAKTRLSEAVDRWRYGANSEQLARLLVDPDAARLARLAMMNPDSAAAWNYVAGLLGSEGIEAEQRLTGALNAGR